ncbi:unnamed protein product [Lactuca saligna]|uniref:Transmembrane 9 superfamily member n=1 Tax=Lactuca saligna TaxID=75948 RepID=A0AA35V4F9_LACSI|nr:unnamed protein product [Lactuca saligna]
MILRPQDYLLQQNSVVQDLLILACSHDVSICTLVLGDRLDPREKLVICCQKAMIFAETQVRCIITADEVFLMTGNLKSSSKIIHVNLTQENPKPLDVGKTLDMTYSVKWIETNITFARRFDVYLDYHFFEHQIHWFSIFNSFMTVIFLTGLVSMILIRTLRNDYAKYAREDDDLESLERYVSDESGWKLVHGDVFRPPRNLVLLSAVVGTGAQLDLLILRVILFAIDATLYIGKKDLLALTLIKCGDDDENCHVLEDHEKKLRTREVINERANKKLDTEKKMKEKEKLHQKIIELQKKLDDKQQLELEIKQMEGTMEVMKHMTHEDVEAKKNFESIKEDMKEKEEELEDLEELNQSLVIKERLINDELQDARKELILFEGNMWLW